MCSILNQLIFKVLSIEYCIEYSGLPGVSCGLGKMGKSQSLQKESAGWNPAYQRKNSGLKILVRHTDSPGAPDHICQNVIHPEPASELSGKLFKMHMSGLHHNPTELESQALRSMNLQFFCVFRIWIFWGCRGDSGH